MGLCLEQMKQTKAALLARETMRNNLTAEWSGDNLVVTNTGGGKISLSWFLSRI